MYSKEMEQLKVAINATDVLIDGLGNVYASIDSITLNIEPLKGSIDALLFARQNLLAQLKVLEEVQLNAQQDLVHIMEP